MAIIFYLIIFIFGLIIGSFLNVVICRLESGEKIINDRSRCPRCKHILAWYDLIPVLSFVFLKGKCRYCKSPVSLQYPLVEIVTAIMFVLILNFKFLIPTTPYPLLAKEGIYPISNIQYPILYLLFWFYITSSLIIIFVYDLKHYIIPDKVVYPAIGFTFIYKLFEILKFGYWELIGNWKLEIGNLITALNPLVAAILAAVFFLGIVIFTRGRGMGGGDVKLAFLMGLLLGWPLVIVAVFSSFILGSIVGIFLILAGKKKMKSMIPFGPFLVIGTFLALFWGEKIIKWYLNILH